MLHVMLFFLFLLSNMILRNLVLHSDELRNLKYLMILLLKVNTSMIRISERIVNINWER